MLNCVKYSVCTPWDFCIQSSTMCRKTDRTYSWKIEQQRFTIDIKLVWNDSNGQKFPQSCNLCCWHINKRFNESEPEPGRTKLHLVNSMSFQYSRWKLKSKNGSGMNFLILMKRIFMISRKPSNQRYFFEWKHPNLHGDINIVFKTVIDSSGISTSSHREYSSI